MILLKIRGLDKMKSINKINIGIKNVARRDGDICTPRLVGEESKRLWMDTQTLHCRVEALRFTECDASKLKYQPSLYRIVAKPVNCFHVRG